MYPSFSGKLHHGQVAEDLPPRERHFGKRVIQLIKLKDPITYFLRTLGVSTDVDFLRGIAGFLAFLIQALVGVSLLGTMGLDIRPLITTLGLSGFVVGKCWAYVVACK